MDSFEEAKTALKRNVKDMAEFTKTKRRWLPLGADCTWCKKNGAGNKKSRLFFNL